MSNIDYRYEVQKNAEHQLLTFLFVSEGKNKREKVIKIIQYQYVKHIHQKPMYNLSFGDFDITTLGINDRVLTGNGDTC